jgi:hypothetical protein
MACINPPTADTSVSINWHWMVQFYQPSLEALAIEDVYELKVDTRLPLSDGAASQAFIDLFCKGSDFGDGTSGVTPADSAILRPSDFTPELPTNTYLALPQAITLCSDTGATGAPETAIITHIAVFSNRICPFYSLDGKTFTRLVATKPFSIRPMGCPILAAGTIFEEDDLSDGLNELRLAQRSRVRRSLTSAPQLKQLPSGKIVSMTSSKRS